MLAQVESATVVGIQSFPVEVEVDVGRGLPSVVVVGLPDAAVKESKDRVKSAVQNSGFFHPDGRIAINLAPADVRKEGPLFDLPVALGLLVATEQAVLPKIDDYVVVGELALNGKVRRVRGALPLALGARHRKKKGIIVPAANAEEAGVVEGLDIIPVENLRQAVDFLSGTLVIAPFRRPLESLWSVQTDAHDFDFSEVKGQESVKRALEVAVAGGHNLFPVWCKEPTAEILPFLRGKSEYSHA